MPSRFARPEKPAFVEKAYRDLPGSGDQPEIGHATPRRPKGMRPRPTECLNCGKKPLYSHFCPDCGQENLNYAVPLGVLLEDVLEEFWKWDGKLLRTLTLLVFRPGSFTKEYNAGRRARYVSPFKLYLGTTALFFLVLFLPSTMSDWQQRLHPDAAPSSPPPKTTPKRAASKTEKTGKLRMAFADNPKQGIRISEDGSFDEDYDSTKFFGGNFFTPKDLREQDVKEGHPHNLRAGHLLEEYDLWQKDKRNKKRDQGVPHLIKQQVLKCVDDTQRFIHELVESAARAMFFLMPFYALFLSLLFRGARKYYVEHLVFAINHHTFAFFLVGLIIVAGKQSSGMAACLVPCYWLHEFLALRTCYHQGKRLTLFKQFILNQLYGFIVVIGLVVTALLTVAFL